MGGPCKLVWCVGQRACSTPFPWSSIFFSSVVNHLLKKKAGLHALFETTKHKHSPIKDMVFFFLWTTDNGQMDKCEKKKKKGERKKRKGDMRHILWTSRVFFFLIYISQFVTWFDVFKSFYDKEIKNFIGHQILSLCCHSL